jgi:hypothetical protein
MSEANPSRTLHPFKDNRKPLGPSLSGSRFHWQLAAHRGTHDFQRATIGTCEMAGFCAGHGDRTDAASAPDRMCRTNKCKNRLMQISVPGTHLGAPLKRRRICVS